MKQYYKIVDGEIIFLSGNILKTQEEIDGKIENVTIYHPTEEMILAAGWMIYEPEVEPDPEPTEEELIEQARNNKLNEISIYDNSNQVNIFYLSGQPLWLDSQTRQTLRISINSYMDMGIEQVTKWFGGQQFTFPINVWITMLNALEIYAAEALNVTEQHKAEVNQLNTIEDIEAYDITVGYPEKLNLTTEWIRSKASGEIS